MAQRPADDDDHSEALRRQALSRVLGGNAPSERRPKGERQPGNIDLSERPRITNPDGSVSTIRSMSFGTPEGEVLVPTAIDGRVVSDKEAMDHYRRTKQHLGIFETPDDATAHAKYLHEREESGQGSRDPEKKDKK